MKVAVKEYCPRDLVGRDTSRRTLAPHSQEDGELFQVGLQAFLDEARTLAKFDHANVVRVRDFFEANGTAYLVMDYYEGESLLEYLERHGGKLPWRAALELMLPVLDGLREVHQRGFLHRDVKPHNIYLTTQGRPILLDFGSARQAMGERSRSLSVMLTEGYAPFEQYTRRGGQGPWTDIYGAAATLYLLVTGQTPPPATERIRNDELIPPRQLVPDLPQPLNAALLYGLATDPQQRPQTMDQFEQLLHGMIEEPEPLQTTLVQSDAPVRPETQDKIKPKLVLSKVKTVLKPYPVMDKLKNNKNLALSTLFLLSTSISIYQFILIWQQAEIGEDVGFTWLFVFSTIVAIWASIDAQTQKLQRSFDFGFYILIFWPITLLYYLIKTRGIIGFFQFLGFGTLYYAPLFLKIFAYVLLRTPSP